MKPLHYFLLLICCPLFSAAQIQRCATAQYEGNAGYRANHHHGFKTMSPDTVFIPVVVHVIYKTDEFNISYEQIQSQIDVLNEDFSGRSYNRAKIPDVWKPLNVDTYFRFQLARTDPDGNPSSGITRTLTAIDAFPVSNLMKANATGGHDPWPDTAYLNIWVCNLANNVLGFAQYPGGSGATDGIVIHTKAFGRIGNLFSRYNKGRTATHETGHWLNLLHIWGDADCGNDFISDTPVQKTSTTNCPSYPKVSCCSASSNCNDPHGDMFMNFMDYTDDQCMMLFTAGQSERMKNAIQLYRPSFSHATAHLPAVLPANDLAVKQIIQPTGLLCNQIHVPKAEVVNSGTTPVTSFTLETGIVDGISQTTSWSGNLLPGESVTVSFEPVKINTGEGVLFCRLLTEDDFLFNNYMTAGYLRVESGYGCPSLEEKPFITLFPNPANDFLNIQTSFKLSGVAHVKLTEVSGKTIMEKQETDTEGFLLNVDIRQLAAGIYFIYVLTDNNQSAAKFFKIND